MKSCLRFAACVLLVGFTIVGCAQDGWTESKEGREAQSTVSRLVKDGTIPPRIGCRGLFILSKYEYSVVVYEVWTNISGPINKAWSNYSTLKASKGSGWSSTTRIARSRLQDDLKELDKYKRAATAASGMSRQLHRELLSLGLTSDQIEQIENDLVLFRLQLLELEWLGPKLLRKAEKPTKV